jgi:hypothetical protein
LSFHDPERLLCAEEGAGEVRVEHVPPVLGVELLERLRPGRDPGVVEKEVERPKRCATFAKREAKAAASRTSAGIATAPLPASAAVRAPRRDGRRWRR